MVALFVAACAAVAASSASASTLTVWNEPQYTKGLNNNWYTQQTPAGDNVYFTCVSAYDNNNAIVGEQSNRSTGGPGSTNCLGNTNGTVATTWALNATTPKLPGHQLKTCFSDYIAYPVITWKSISTTCQATILDNSEPVIVTGINGTRRVHEEPDGQRADRLPGLDQPAVVRDERAGCELRLLEPGRDLHAGQRRGLRRGFTAPGTYQVAASGTDGAGNFGTGTKVITVQPASTGGGTGAGTGTGTGTGSGGGITPTPIKETIKEVAGPVQESSIGTLDVTTGKTFRISSKLKALPLALTAESAGTVSSPSSRAAGPSPRARRS
jgi:hypothetical protein